MRRARFVPALKWTAAVLCLLIAAAWVTSYAVAVYPHSLQETSTLHVGLGHGHVECYYPAGVLTYQTGILFGRVMGMRPGWLPQIQRITVARASSGVPPTNVSRVCWYIDLPLWFAFAVGITIAAWLFHIDRRFAAGSCASCGYDLTGNESGRCPECGAAPPATDAGDSTGT